MKVILTILFTQEIATQDNVFKGAFWAILEPIWNSHILK